MLNFQLLQNENLCGIFTQTQNLKIWKDLVNQNIKTTQMLNFKYCGIKNIGGIITRTLNLENNNQTRKNKKQL